MSQAQIDRLKTFLLAEGFVQGEDFELTASETGSEAVSISVTIPLDHFELPDELKPFEQDPDDVDRAAWKGNTEKKTWIGANFELALRAYGGSIMEKDPEIIELSRRVEANDPADKLTLEEWNATRKAVWDRIWAEPKHAAWEAQLNADFF